MGTYGLIHRRVIAMILMLVALSIIVFLLFNALPGDPARLTCGKSCTPAGHRGQPAPARARQAALRAVRRLRQGHLRRPHLRRRHGDLRVPRAVPGLLVPARRAGHGPDHERAARSPSSSRSAASSSGSSPASAVGIVAALQTRQVAGPHDHGLRPGRLLVPVVLHRPAADLLHPDQVGLWRFHATCPFYEDPVQWFQTYPAVDRDRAPLRGVLLPAHPQPDARDARRGLHPHGARQGPARAHRHRSSTRCAPG